METINSSEQTLCPLLACIGNCYYIKDKQHNQLYSHPIDAVKSVTQQALAKEKKDKKKPLKVGKEFAPVSDGTFFPPSFQDSVNEKKLNKGAQEFIPSYEQNYEEGFDQHADEYDLLDEYNPYELRLEEAEDYFHTASEYCDCCKGYINKCDGIICQALGYCHCYATELEDHAEDKKKKKK
jgi:hypothetical protein